MPNELAVRADVNIDELKQLGALLAQSSYFEKSPDATVAIAQMAVKVLAGRELGYGPFASVNGIHIIKGKPALSANLMAAAVKASARYDYRVRKMDAQLCEIEFFERMADGKRESLGISSFSAHEARAAGTQNMDKFARNMLFARAMSNGVKWYCPDVFNGSTVYVPEELGATVDGEGDVIEGSYSVVTPVTPQSNGGASHAIDGGKSTVEQPGAPAVSGNGKRDFTIGKVSAGTLKHLHGLGTSYYGDEWDTRRPILVKSISKGRAESSKDLTESEANQLCHGIEERLLAQVATVTVDAAPELNPFEDAAAVPA